MSKPHQYSQYPLKSQTFITPTGAFGNNLLDDIPLGKKAIIEHITYVASVSGEVFLYPYSDASGGGVPILVSFMGAQGIPIEINGPIDCGNDKGFRTNNSLTGLGTGTMNVIYREVPNDA